MSWLEYVKQNRTALDLRFMWSKPKHPKHDWKGYYTRHINMWISNEGYACRLYIPISMMSDAGFVDLINKSYAVTSEIEGSEEKLKEVYEYLTEHAG